MQYLALLYAAEDERSDPTTEAFAEDLRGYERFDEIAGDAIVGGEALEPSTQAITVRHRGGEVVVTDGVYTEAAEVVGGLFVLEADDLDAVIALARNIPAAEHGAVELRPLVEWSQQAPGDRTARRYLALLAGEETEADEPGTAAWDAAVVEHERFAADAGERVLGGGALHPAATATTVRVRDGAVELHDGPFMETNEVVGGLYLLLAADDEEVTALAARIPLGPDGVVELRPVMEFDG